MFVFEIPLQGYFVTIFIGKECFVVIIKTKSKGTLDNDVMLGSTVKGPKC